MGVVLGINTIVNLSASAFYQDKNLQTLFKWIGVTMHESNVRERRNNSMNSELREHYAEQVRKIEMEEVI